jgi:hypothetical protein
MAEYGRAIGSVIGATMVVGAVGSIAKKRKKLTMNKTIRRRKRK